MSGLREIRDGGSVNSRCIRCHQADLSVWMVDRLLNNRQIIDDADVLIVVAGMEGALPSVVAGLADCPTIAVPTSIGYGASFGGIAPLLTMLNSCAGKV